MSTSLGTRSAFFSQAALRASSGPPLPGASPVTWCVSKLQAPSLTPSLCPARALHTVGACSR